MIAITPEQAAEAGYVLIEGASYAAISKNPAILPGMQALSAAFLGTASGSESPQAIAQASAEIVKELGIVVSPQLSFIAGAIDGAGAQLAATQNKLSPALTVGIVGTILTTAGNAIKAACALYATNNPPAPAAQ